MGCQDPFLLGNDVMIDSGQKETPEIPSRPKLRPTFFWKSGSPEEGGSKALHEHVSKGKNPPRNCGFFEVSMLNCVSKHKSGPFLDLSHVIRSLETVQVAGSNTGILRHHDPSLRKRNLIPQMGKAAAEGNLTGQPTQGTLGTLPIPENMGASLVSKEKSGGPLMSFPNKLF